MSILLEVQNLSVKIEKKTILNKVNLSIKEGEIHVIMGPNGSGKSTLANVLMGNPKYEVVYGEIFFRKKDITKMAPEERAALGMFMAFQYPREIAGVSVDSFLFTAYKNIQKLRHSITPSPVTIFDFNEKLKKEAQKLKLNPELVSRSINQGFSGGEKKKAEMLQLSVLEPTFAILDETDSGLDVDALKIVGNAIKNFQNNTRPGSKQERSVLIVTHYQRILKYLKPDFIHVMVDGTIVKTGGAELAHQLEEKGYEKF